MSAEANIVIRLSDGKKAGETIKELRQQSNRLTRDINNLKPGTEAFVKKSKDLQMVNSRLKDVRGQVNGVKTANVGLIQTMSQYIPFGGHLQNLAGGFQAAGGGAKAFGMALKMIPLIFIISLIVKMIQWWSQMQGSMDAITAVTRPLNAVFQRLIGVLQPLVDKWLKGLAEGLKNPKQAMIDLGKIIKENIINRLTALNVLLEASQLLFSGKFSEGLKKAGDGIIQMSTGITDGTDKLNDLFQATSEVVKEGWEIGKQLDGLTKQIEKNEIVLTKRRAELNAEYARSKEIAQDLENSTESRIAAARKAHSAQNELLQLEQSFLEMKIEKMKLEHTLNDTSRADKLELAKLEAELIQFEASAAKKRASARSLEVTAIREARTSQDKALKAAQKKEAENTKFLSEQAKEQERIQKEINKSRLDGIEDDQARELALLEQSYNDKEQKISELEQILVDKKRSIKEQEREELATAKEEEIQGIIDQTAAKMEAIEETSALLKEQKVALVESEEMATYEVKKKYADQSAADEEKRKTDQMQQELEIHDAKLAIAQAMHDTSINTTTAMVELFGKQSAAAKAAMVIQRTMAIFEIGLQLRRQWMAASLTGAKIAAIAPPATIALGKLYEGAAKASAATFAFAQISQLKKMKFEKGGMLKGARHSGGGIPGTFLGQPIEMEDGEIILNRRVGLDPKGRAAASALNAAYGGRKFDLGGPVNAFSKPVSSSKDRSPLSMDGVIDEIRMLRADVADQSDRMNAWQSNLKVTNNLQETEEGIKVLNKLSDEAAL